MPLYYTVPLSSVSITGTAVMGFAMQVNNKERTQKKGLLFSDFFYETFLLDFFFSPSRDVVTTEGAQEASEPSSQASPADPL